MTDIDPWEAAGPRERERMIRAQDAFNRGKFDPSLIGPMKLAPWVQTLPPDTEILAGLMPASVTAVTHSNPSDL